MYRQQCIATRRIRKLKIARGNKIAIEKRAIPCARGLCHFSATATILHSRINACRMDFHCRKQTQQCDLRENLDYALRWTCFCLFVSDKLSCSLHGLVMTSYAMTSRVVTTICDPKITFSSVLWRPSRNSIGFLDP